MPALGFPFTGIMTKRKSSNAVMGTFYNKKMFSLFHLCFGSIIAIHIFAVSGLRFPSHSISVYRRFQCRFRLFRTCNLKHITWESLSFSTYVLKICTDRQENPTKTHIWKQKKKYKYFRMLLSNIYIYIYIPNSMQDCRFSLASSTRYFFQYVLQQQLRHIRHHTTYH